MSFNYLHYRMQRRPGTAHFCRNHAEYHCGKHHQTYVTNLNNRSRAPILKAKRWKRSSRNSEGSVFNNAAQVWNHPSTGTARRQCRR